MPETTEPERIRLWLYKQTGIPRPYEFRGFFEAHPTARGYWLLVKYESRRAGSGDAWGKERTEMYLDRQITQHTPWYADGYIGALLTWDSIIRSALWRYTKTHN